MNKYEFTFSEENSGGEYRMSWNDWHALSEAGWDVNWGDYDGTDYSYNPSIATKTYVTPNEDAAHNMGVAEWEALTVLDPYEQAWCNCCGDPFHFRVEEVEYNPEDAFRDAVRVAMDEGMSHTECERILDVIFYNIQED